MLNLKDLFNRKDLNVDLVVHHNDDIPCGLLDWDRTHLNDHGYHIMMRKSAISLAIHHYEGARLRSQAIASKEPKPKVSRRHRRTMAKRKRANETNWTTICETSFLGGGIGTILW